MHFRSLFQETHQLFGLCDSLRVIVRSKHIPDRCNVLKDGIFRSRQLLILEWPLHQEVAHLIFREWGCLMLDLFATRLIITCHLCQSRVWTQRRGRSTRSRSAGHEWSLTPFPPSTSSRRFKGRFEPACIAMFF